MEAVFINISLERYEHFMQCEILLKVINSLLDSCVNSVDFETAVRRLMNGGVIDVDTL